MPASRSKKDSKEILIGYLDVQERAGVAASGRRFGIHRGMNSFGPNQRFVRQTQHRAGPWMIIFNRFPSISGPTCTNQAREQKIVEFATIFNLVYEVSIFQITRFLNPRIFHLRFVKFPNPLDSLPSSTLLFNVTIEAFSRTRVKRTNRGGRSAI